MDTAQEMQLQVIGEVTSLLQAAALPHWLFGGWAIDFQLGEITRAHDDVEFLVWEHDVPHMTTLLVQHEYEKYTGGIVDEMAIFFKHAQKLELDFLTHNAHGQVVVAGRWSDWWWTEGALDAPPSTLAGITCPVISAEGLLAVKQGYAAHPAGAPLREKDITDIQQLLKLIKKSAS
jgi:hypothetical protein